MWQFRLGSLCSLMFFIVYADFLFFMYFLLISPVASGSNSFNTTQMFFEVTLMELTVKQSWSSTIDARFHRFLFIHPLIVVLCFRVFSLRALMRASEIFKVMQKWRLLISRKLFLSCWVSSTSSSPVYTVFSYSWRWKKGSRTRTSSQAFCEISRSRYSSIDSQIDFREPRIHGVDITPWWGLEAWTLQDLF